MIGQLGALPEKISKLIPSTNCISDKIRSGNGLVANHSFASVTLTSGPINSAPGSNCLTRFEGFEPLIFHLLSLIFS
jgi:hypothetical protein